VPDPDRRQLNALAAVQGGLFSLSQAAELGYTDKRLAGAVRRGEFRRVRRSVYAIGGARPASVEPAIAAALAVGRAVVVSHASAAAVHGLWCAPPRASPVELTVVGPGRDATLPGVNVHRRRQLPPADVEIRYGVQVTTPARTLVDLASRLAPSRLAKALDEGVLARHWSVPDVARCVARTDANFPGRRRLSALLAERDADALPDSGLELRVFRILAPLRPFCVHHVVTVAGATYVLDMAWPELRVAVEIDGRRHRLASRSAFDRDRAKGNALALAGWRVAHLTSTMKDAEMLGVVGQFLGRAPFGGPRAARASRVE
jgi:hypothetical protein